MISTKVRDRYRPWLILAIVAAAPGIGGAATGGPDPFGYHWADSGEAWADTTEPLPDGSPAFRVLGENTLTRVDFPPGFTFLYYGTRYSSVTVSDNGWLSVLTSNPDSAPTNQPLPSPAAPRGVLAFYWADLNPAAGSLVHGPAGQGSAYWLWLSGSTRPSGGRFTVNVALYADGRILYSYRAVSDPGMVAVGIEDTAGATGLQCLLNGAPAPGFDLRQGYAVVFFPPPSLDCTAAEALTCGGYSTYNRRSPATVTRNVLSYECARGLFAGNEAVFALTVSQPSTLNASISGIAPRSMGLFLLDSCSELLGCLEGGDTQITRPGLAPGTYYLVVDGRTSGDDGPFDFTLACGEDRLDCASAGPISCNQTVSSDTRTGVRNNASYSCSTEAFTGTEVLYRFTNPFEQQVGFFLDDSGAGLDFMVLRSCDPMDCLQIGDQGLNCLHLPAGEYYLVVDGRDGRAGAFSLDLACGTLLAQPDLAPVSMETAGLTGDCRSGTLGGSLRLTLKNSSTEAESGSFLVRAFEDVDFDGAFNVAADQALGAIRDAGGLVPGEERDVVIPVTGSVAFFPGVIHVMVDADGEIAEADESNNVSSTADQCEVRNTPGVFRPYVKWQVGRASGLSSSMIARINDDNGDGRIDEHDYPDVVFQGTGADGGGTPHLVALSGKDGSFIFDTDLPGIGSRPASDIAVGDIDLDGKPEIVLKGDGGQILAYENDGTLKWGSTTGFSSDIIHGSAVLADLDRDEVPEIIYGRWCYNADGTLRWEGLGSHGLLYPISCVADLDLDGYPEVVAGNRAYRNDGRVYWAQDTLPYSYCGIADFDADGYPEVVLVGFNEMSVLSHDGNVIWGPVLRSGRGTGGGPPVIADFDNDCVPEVGTCFEDRYEVFESDGTSRWWIPIQESQGVAGSVAADLDGDGLVEIVVPEMMDYRGKGRLLILRGHDGAILASLPSNDSGDVNLPAIADIDLDNRLDVVHSGAGSTTDVFSDDSWVNGRKVWNQNPYHVTNINDDLTVPAREVNNWEVYNTYRTQVTDRPFVHPDVAPSLVTGDCTEVRARIGNAGGGYAAEGTRVEFFNGDPRSGGTLIGQAVTSLLPPGRYEDLAVPWAVPTGTYTVYVLVDGGNGAVGSLAECKEDNNECAAALTVDCPQCRASARAGTDADICEGDTASLSGALSTLANCPGGMEYRWSWPGTPGTWGADPALNVTPLDTTTYTLEVRCSVETDCTAADDVVVTVHRFPVVDAGLDLTACVADPLTLDGSRTACQDCRTGLYYRFSIQGGPVVRDWAADPSYFFTAGAPGATTYLLEAYCNDLQQCVSSDTVTVEVKDCPTAVRYASYDAVVAGDHAVSVRWQTLSEIDTLGFVVERFCAPGAPGDQFAFVPARGPGAPYELLDALDPALDPVTLSYRISEIAAAGTPASTPVFPVTPPARSLDRGRDPRSSRSERGRTFQ